MMAGDRFVAVVGARALPESQAARVGALVQFLLGRGWGIGSGGARGADAFALAAVLAAGPAACVRSVIFLPGPADPRANALRAIAAQGGRLVAGTGGGRVALLARSRRLAQAAAGVVAFLWGPSRGSVYTVREAIRAGKPAAVVLAGGGAELPAFPGGRWLPCQLGAVRAFRWVPDPEASAANPRPSGREPWLARVFHVPEGEPTHALLAHISSLSPGERFWFERGVLAGGAILVPHEALSDTPAFLATRRLMRRGRCSVREAAGLSELFLALDAGPDVVAHYERDVRHRGAVPVIAELVQLVAQLALAEPDPDTDALDHADRLGEETEALPADGRVAQSTVQPEPVFAQLAWYALGIVQPERATCPVCSAAIDTDPDEANLPSCPRCHTVDTWEARQGPRFRGLVADIDRCPSLEDLADLGKRLYTLGGTARC